MGTGFVQRVNPLCRGLPRGLKPVARRPRRPQCSFHPRPRKRAIIASSEPDQPEAAGGDSLEAVPSKLDWRQFRASLVAKEKRETAEPAEASEDTDGQAERSAPGSESTSGNTEDRTIWAHQISLPETGCLLISKSSAGNMGFFNNSVVLLLQHDNSTGSLGLLLGRKLKSRPQGPFAQIISMVAGMYVGGPVGMDKILILHGPPQMEDSLELLEDLYVGGWKGAQARISEASAVDAEALPELSVYSGSCGWSRWQLEHEERTGAWWVVSASPKFVRSVLQGVESELGIRRKVFELAGISEDPSPW